LTRIRNKLPNILESKLVQLLLPVSKTLLVLSHDLLILLKFVAHLNLNSASLVQDGGLGIELAFKCLEFFLLGVQGLCLVSILSPRKIRFRDVPLGLPPPLSGILQCF
jgi:hypothetical protein